MKNRTQLTKDERQEVKRIIKEKTNYFIKSNAFLEQIFRRSSFAAETGQNSNEIFEFIGDQVLGYYVVKAVAKRCGAISLANSDYSFRIKENKFTQIKQFLVKNETLAKIIDEWGIAKYLLWGKSDTNNNALESTKAKADLLEAIFGAIAVESGWDSQILENAVAKSIHIDAAIDALIELESKMINVDIDNAITVLKEQAENGQCTMPEYVFDGPDKIGFDKDGNPKWRCRCCIINSTTGITKSVHANSKKDAKKAAAYLVLCDHLGLQNIYGENKRLIEWIYKDEKLLNSQL